MFSHLARIHYNTPKKCVCYYHSLFRGFFGKIRAPAGASGGCCLALGVDALALRHKGLIVRAATVAAWLPALALIAAAYRLSASP